MSVLAGAFLGTGIGLAVLWVFGVRARFYQDGEDYVLSIYVEWR